MQDSRYRDLINQISLENDLHAFERLFKGFYERLLGFAMVFVRNNSLAEEVVMDVFLKVWERRERLLSVKNLETFFYVTVRNKSMDYLRKLDKKPFDSLECIPACSNIDLSTPEQEIISQEEIVKIFKAIDELPPKCRQVLKLIREEGMSKKEVSEIMDISIKTIDNQLAIGVKKVAETLGVDLEVKSKRLIVNSVLLLC